MDRETNRRTVLMWQYYSWEISW